MAVDVDVTADVDGFARFIRFVDVKQIPFATSKALNAAALDARKHVGNVTYPRSFKVRSRAVPKVAFRVAWSNKRNLIARVFTTRGFEYLTTQAHGGIKTPRRSRYLKIPVSDAQRTRGGKVKDRGGRTQFTDRWAGKLNVYRREGPRGRAGRAPLFWLRPEARIPARFPFEREVIRIANKSFKREFPRCMRVAINTAKRRFKK